MWFLIICMNKELIVTGTGDIEVAWGIGETCCSGGFQVRTYIF